MANRHMKRCSALLIIREKQIRTTTREKKKPTVRYHFTPIRMAIIKKSANNIIHAEKGVKKREPAYTVAGNLNWYSQYAE